METIALLISLWKNALNSGIFQRLKLFAANTREFGVYESADVLAGKKGLCQRIEHAGA
jgi:hypothetical protein